MIHQAEEGPIRTHLIINSHRLATFQDIKTEVTNVKQAQSTVMAWTGDAMDVDAFKTGSSKGVSKGTGKRKDSEVVRWYHDKAQSKGSKKGDSKGQGNNQEFKCGKTGHMSKDCRSKETSALEAGEEGLAENGCIEMASTDLNALEIGAVHLPEKDHKIRIGIDSRAQAGVRQASAGSWCAKGAGQAHRWVSQVRELESGGDAQSCDGTCQR